MIDKTVSVATLLARLFIGWRFLTIIIQLTHYLDKSNILLLVGSFIALVGGGLLVIGLFTRWVSGILILYFILLALVGFGFYAISSNLTSIVILLIILLLGPGAYSYDHLRRRGQP